MQVFTVLWSDLASKDVLAIVEFISRDAPANAQVVLSRIETAAARLDRFPQRGRVVPELSVQGISTIREIIESPWRLVYECDGKTVMVVGVWDARRDLASVLLGRLLEM